MNVVVIGGGTGSFTVLRGLKDRVESLAAIVSMFDNGGSTGVLRDEFGILPPGDVRRCLVALSPEQNIVRELFMYRFDDRLSGHSFGNLFLTALNQITGSMETAIEQASRILAIKGRVIPVSLDNCQLCAELADGTLLSGETTIDIPKGPRSPIKKVYLEPLAHANPRAIDAILSADLIVIGPGDLFTSVIPNLLVQGISEALAKTRAKKIYVCNLMTKFGETNGFPASAHVREIMRYGVKPDLVLCNTQQGTPELLAKYARGNQFPVEIDADALKKLGVRLVTADVMSTPELIRHDSDKLARALLSFNVS